MGLTGWTVSIILERDDHGSWTRWSRKVAKNEIFTVSKSKEVGELENSCQKLERCKCVVNIVKKTMRHLINICPIKPRERTQFFIKKKKEIQLNRHSSEYSKKVRHQSRWSRCIRGWPIKLYHERVWTWWMWRGRRKNIMNLLFVHHPTLNMTNK